MHTASSIVVEMREETKKIKGENAYHDKSKVRYLKMLKSGAPSRNSKGKITREAEYASTKPSNPVVRIEPNRRWFGNTRTINQDNLDKLREELDKKTRDSYQVLLKLNKLPMSLLTDHTKKSKMNLLEVEGFSETFGKNASRKRPKLSVTTLEEFAKSAECSYDDSIDNTETIKEENLAMDPLYKKGQSKRLWNELYKVLDSSDVIVHVLDARDPHGTRCKRIEQFIQEEAKHKHLVFLLNKCDLVPPGVASKWVECLSKEYPTIAYRASLTHVFGKAALINLLRQYSKLHPERKQISVGFVGYPNTGKSSIINSLKKKQVCPVAPIPGQTKVWQYVALMKRIYLIDCPGVVPNIVSNDTMRTELVLRGAIRIENIEDAEDHISAVLDRVKVIHLCKTYNIQDEWSDSVDFLTRIAKKSGRLLKGGEPDICTVAKMVLSDYIRGNLPHFTVPTQEH